MKICRIVELYLFSSFALMSGYAFAMEQKPSEELGAQLFQAVIHDNFDEVVCLLEKGAPVDYAEEHGITPLQIAAHHGEYKIVEALLARQPKVNTKAAGAANFFPLYMATLENHPKVVELLLKNGANPNLSTGDRMTSLMKAAESGHLKIVELLIQAGANVRAKGPGGTTALSLAAEGCHPAIISLLIKHGAQANDVDERGVSPLLLAAQEGCIETVELLLKHNVSVNLQAHGLDNISALRQAAQNGHLEIVKLLLQAGADANIADNRGYTPLIIAAEKGHIAIVNLLLAHHALPNAQVPETNKITALTQAANHGHAEIVAILLKAGAQIDLPKASGYTPLMIAAEAGHVECARILLHANADPFIQAAGAFINTFALRQATQNGHLEIVKLLLTAISNIDAERIKHNFTGLLAMNRMYVQGTDYWTVCQWEEGENVKACPTLKKPRQLILQRIMNDLIQERMERADRMLALRDAHNATVYDVALGHNHAEIAKLLDPKNLDSRAEISRMIESNINRILFGEPKKTRNE